MANLLATSFVEDRMIWGLKAKFSLLRLWLTFNSHTQVGGT